MPNVPNLDTKPSYPEGVHRDDMEPLDALDECYDLWASGAWPDENAQANLDETMQHIERLLGRSTDGPSTPNWVIE